MAAAPASKVVQQAQLLHLARLLWRGKGLVAACLALAVLPAVLILQQVTPRYTAEVVLVVSAPEAASSLLDNQTRTFLNDATIQTEAEVLGSSTLARRGLDRMTLWEDPEFNAEKRPPRLTDTILGWLNPVAALGRLFPAPEARELSAPAREEMKRDAVVAAFRSRLTVTALRRSHTISLRFTSENREKAAQIANTLADLYVMDRLEAGFEETRRVTAWLGERLEGLRRDVSVAERAVESQRAAFGLRRKDDKVLSVTDQQLTEINSRLVIARAELAQRQARLAQVRALQESRGSSDTAFDVLQSQLIQRLREQEAVKQRELSEASKTYGDRHPQIIGIRADLDELHRKIGQEIERVVLSLKNEVDVAAAGARALEGQLDALKKRGDAAAGEQVHLRELERDAEVSRTLYESFLARFQRDTEQERIKRANARVISPAIIPTAPSWPPKPQALAIVACAALMFGIGLVLLRDRLDNSVRSADEIDDLTGLPTLAMVPLVRPAKGVAPEDQVLGRPHSTLADSLRGLRTVLDSPSTGAEGPITMVTSSLPKEGKSFVARGLARMAARSGRRVLLIDSDLHRPRQHALQAVDNSRGLVQVLAGEVGLDEVIVHEPESGLDLLPAGLLPTDTSEILSSPQLAEFIRSLPRRWDRVIIDTPPALVVSDAQLLVRVADQVVYVIKWNATPREAVRNGVRILADAGAKFAGVVLSQVDGRRHAGYHYGDYGQYHDKYHAYYSE